MDVMNSIQIWVYIISLSPFIKYVMYNFSTIFGLYINLGLSLPMQIKNRLFFMF